MNDAILHSEIVEWQAYEDVVGPLPDRRSDYQTAHIVAMMANLHGRDPKEHPEAFPIAKFVLDYQRKIEAEASEDGGGLVLDEESKAPKAGAQKPIGQWMAERMALHKKRQREAQEARASKAEIPTMPADPNETQRRRRRRSG